MVGLPSASANSQAPHAHAIFAVFFSVFGMLATPTFCFSGVLRMGGHAIRPFTQEPNCQCTGLATTKWLLGEERLKERLGTVESQGIEPMAEPTLCRAQDFLAKLVDFPKLKQDALQAFILARVGR